MEKEDIKIKSVRKHTVGKWIVQYETWSPCGCTYIRKTVLLIQRREPTTEQIMEKIKNGA